MIDEVAHHAIGAHIANDAARAEIGAACGSGDLGMVDNAGHCAQALAHGTAHQPGPLNIAAGDGHIHDRAIGAKIAHQAHQAVGVGRVDAQVADGVTCAIDRAAEPSRAVDYIAAGERARDARNIGTECDVIAQDEVLAHKVLARQARVALGDQLGQVGLAADDPGTGCRAIALRQHLPVGPDDQPTSKAIVGLDKDVVAVGRASTGCECARTQVEVVAAVERRCQPGGGIDCGTGDEVATVLAVGKGDRETIKYRQGLVGKQSQAWIGHPIGRPLAAAVPPDDNLAREFARDAGHTHIVEQAYLTVIPHMVAGAADLARHGSGIVDLRAISHLPNGQGVGDRRLGHA